MRIKSFWARGYRSLRELDLSDLGTFNIFYGENGTGKSNILCALDCLFTVLAYRTWPEFSFTDPHELTGTLRLEELLDPRDRCNLTVSPNVVLGATLAWPEDAPWATARQVAFHELQVEITFVPGTPYMAVSRLMTGSEDLLGLFGPDSSEAHAAHAAAASRFFTTEAARAPGAQLAKQGQAFIHHVANRAYALVGADRIPRPENVDTQETDVAALLRAGRFQLAMLRASKHTDTMVRTRFKQFQALLEGAPLYRPSFDITEDPTTNRVALVEYQSDAPDGARDTPLDLAGLGIAQIYSILAQILLRGRRAVGIEEPEAHLHAPSTGMHLRKLLHRLASEGFVDQLFIATHSNLFDLDPDGFYEVTLDAHAGTQVVRKPIHEIDAHLYEPGPAKRALREFLAYMGDEVVFHRPDGTPVRSREMTRLLEADDELGLAFIRAVHQAAVRSVIVEHDEEPE